MGRPSLNLTGQTFGRLTAIRPVGRKQGGVLWECRCTCGTVKAVPAGALTGGGVTSCGCFKRELGQRRKAAVNHRTDQYRDLRAKGWTCARIAAKFGVTRQAVSQATRPK